MKMWLLFIRTLPVALGAPLTWSSPADLEAQVAQIVSNMTVHEKARQLVTSSGDECCIYNGAVSSGPAGDKSDPYGRIPGAKAFLGSTGFGRLHDVYSIHPAQANALQRLVVASSRFEIGAILGEECTHGYQKDGHTLFPAPITSGMTFNTSLLHAIGRAIGREAKSFGASECWAPILGLAREPRWGRTNEEFSEDTHLATELGRAMVLGLQNDNNFDDPSEPAVAAMMKHYAIYSGPSGGLNTAGARIGRREALADWLPTFGAGAEAGALGVMSSYNGVDGEAASASHWLLTEVLRDEYNFSGCVTGDFGAIGKLADDQHVAANHADAVRQYLNAGGNMAGYDVGNYEGLVANLSTSDPSVAPFKLDPKILDARVQDVLRVKAKLGLIGDGPRMYVDESWGARWNNAPEHRQLAYEAAQQAQTLLRNQKDKVTGKPLLPLDAAAIRTVAVLGGNSDNPRFGDYTGAEHDRGGNVQMTNAVGVLAAIKAALPHADVTHVVGIGIAGPVHPSPIVPTSSTSSPISARKFGGGGGAAAAADPFPLAEHGCGAGGGSEVIRHHHFRTPSGHAGVQGDYFNNSRGDFSGAPAFTRTDASCSFHWYHSGPQGGSRTFVWGGVPKWPSAFSAKWSGTITADATAAGAFNILANGAYGGKAFGGARLIVEGQTVIDIWDKPAGLSSGLFNFTKGKAVSFELHYRKGPGNGNIELQWSLTPQSGPNPEQRGIDEAVAAAKAADVSVLVVGGSSRSTNEGLDRAELGLIGMQLQLVQQVHAACKAARKKLVLVLVGGKPIAEPWIAANVEAIIYSGEAGQAQGTATVEVILGKLNPAGRLSVSWPKSAAALPIYYSYHSGSRGGNYCDLGDPTALWAFGHGLSYTKFAYSDLKISPQKVPMDGVVTVSFSVSNTGERDGSEVAQLYVRDEVSSVITPVKLLKGFQRVFIRKGAKATIAMKLDVRKDLWLVNLQHKKVVEPGTFAVMVGGSSDGAGKELVCKLAPAQCTFEIIA